MASYLAAIHYDVHTHYHQKWSDSILFCHKYAAARISSSGFEISACLSHSKYQKLMVIGPEE